ncbi:hypothetical protein ACFTAO_02315 [Paenibacillus rhizoplanae]|uniref:hypothetical protein n=1 Tax=Paenibacillus sp. FSL P4-0338 TaxID=2921635 RepID=UPI0030F8C92C
MEDRIPLRTRTESRLRQPVCREIREDYLRPELTQPSASLRSLLSLPQSPQASLLPVSTDYKALPQ